MRTILFIALLALFTLPAFSQSREEVLAEGWLLYNSEKASWHGTDIFMAKFPEQRESIGGYFSYSEGEKHTCIFFDKEEDPGVLAAISFNDNFVVEAAEIKTAPRKLNADEKELYIIREKALQASSDTIFKRYNNTNLNFIPIIIKGKKMVYALTGPSVSGVVVFGNDYLITFDKKNNVTSTKVLHNNIIPIEFTNNPDEVTTMHSHNEKTGDLITATDICTLLLYSPYTHWQRHIVISKENVSIWDCTKDELLVMTRKAWEKIDKD